MQAVLECARLELKLYLLQRWRLSAEDAAAGERVQGIQRSQQKLHFRVTCTVSCLYLLPHGSIKGSDPVLPLYFTDNLYNPPKNLDSSETMSALGCILYFWLVVE